MLGSGPAGRQGIGTAEFWRKEMKEQSLKKKKVAVMMGGLSREREISLKTGKAILKALIIKGYAMTAIDVGEDIPEKIIKEKK